MKSIKKMIWIAAIGLAAMQASAQTKSDITDDNGHNSYDRIHNQNGRQVEEIQMWMHDKAYKVELAGDKMISLSIDGKAIPESDWGRYSDDIAAVKEQIRQNRIQAKKNEEQARLNEIQAKKNQEQATRNELQEKKNEEQAMRNQGQDKLNEVQAKKNEEQARLNKIQEEKNQEQAVRNEEQAKHNQEQAVRNEEQEKLNEIQAKKNQEQAEANERFIKSITADLVADKIIPNGNSLHRLTFNG